MPLLNMIVNPMSVVNGLYAFIIIFLVEGLILSIFLERSFYKGLIYMASFFANLASTLIGLPVITTYYNNLLRFSKSFENGELKFYILFFSTCFVFTVLIEILFNRLIINKLHKPNKMVRATIIANFITYISISFVQVFYKII